MKSSCINEGCVDVQTTVSFVKLYQWPESDKEFLRRLSLNKERDEDQTSSSSTYLLMDDDDDDHKTRVSRVLGAPAMSSYCHESFSSRQKFLRSYNFSRKESFSQKTKKYLVRMMKPKRSNNNRSASGGSNGGCCFVDTCLRYLLVCVVKVDVHDP
ncbi:uncharacterized protein LOC132316413 [Cornus florida]|uniref:uncharacterized protein LOC132316413 n=1 Tax=Cornus florida TaxID=4283 RepID=UPI00289EF0D8|nr:uncharacterized protein LOC132316413 [Cornus florida]